MTGGARQPTAEDHGRLLQDHDAVVEQLVAADAVLIALGRSSSDADADAVMTTVAESARRLCRCQGVSIYLLHGEEFELAATVGLPPEFRSYVAAHPLRRDRETMAGRVALDRRIEQVSDVLARPRLRPERRARDRRFPHPDRRAADPRRRGGGRDQPVANQGGAFRRTRDGDAPDLRRPGRRRGTKRAPGTRTGGTAARAGAQGRAAAGPQRGRRNRQLDPRSRRGAVQDHPQRRAVRGVRRWLDHGVCRGRTPLPGQDDISQQPRAVVGTAQDQDRAGRDPRRPGRTGRAPDRDLRYRARRPGRPSRSCCTRTAGGRSSPSRCCATARSSASWWSGGRHPGTSPTRSWTSSRRSPASPRWRCPTPASFASSSARAPSWRWRASTSRISWRACLTS